MKCDFPWNLHTLEPIVCWVISFLVTVIIYCSRSLIPVLGYYFIVRGCHFLIGMVWVWGTDSIALGSRPIFYKVELEAQVPSLWIWGLANFFWTWVLVCHSCSHKYSLYLSGIWDPIEFYLDLCMGVPSAPMKSS